MPKDPSQPPCEILLSGFSAETCPTWVTLPVALLPLDTPSFIGACHPPGHGFSWAFMKVVPPGEEENIIIL